MTRARKNGSGGSYWNVGMDKVRVPNYFESEYASMLKQKKQIMYENLLSGYLSLAL